MKHKRFLAIIISILLISTISITIAYKDEIKQSSKDLFTKYFQEKLDYLSQEQQQDFQDFRNQETITKFKTALDLNSKNNGGINDE